MTMGVACSSKCRSRRRSAQATNVTTARATPAMEVCGQAADAALGRGFVSGDTTPVAAGVWWEGGELGWEVRGRRVPGEVAGRRGEGGGGVAWIGALWRCA